MNEDFIVDDAEVVVGDPREEAAAAALERFFDERRESVFFSRQLEVIHESDWYHWITNRALRDLIAADVIRSEVRLARAEPVIPASDSSIGSERGAGTDANSGSLAGTRARSIAGCGSASGPMTCRSLPSARASVSRVPRSSCGRASVS